MRGDHSPGNRAGIGADTISNKNNRPMNVQLIKTQIGDP